MYVYSIYESRFIYSIRMVVVPSDFWTAKVYGERVKNIIWIIVIQNVLVNDFYACGGRSYRWKFSMPNRTY